MGRPGVIAALFLVATCAWSGSAAAQVARSTYRVPVSQPDELGLPVQIETDVYLPSGPAPAGGRPLVVFFHGGGSSKDNEFDSEHAGFMAKHGYAAILYSARGHGGSGGQTSVAGPKEVRDTFDVLAWALGLGGRDLPRHPGFGIDADRIALSGYSQGGLHTNLGQAWSSDAALNPYGIRFRALEPGNTPDRTFLALVPNQVAKLSFGVALLGTYAGGAQGRVAPVVDKWIATVAADRPELYGGDVCDMSSHDTAASTMKQDLAARSAGCMVEQMTPPSLWAQAFDDTLFPADMAISMWRRMPDRAHNRLYLSMGGHAAPSATKAVERAKLEDQLAFLDHVLRGRALKLPKVTYYSRDPSVAVPLGTSGYPDRAWLERRSETWPPPGTRDVVYRLAADGTLQEGDAAEGSMLLQPFSQDAANDPVARAAVSSTPLGSSPTPAAPPSSGVPGQVAAFATAPFRSDRELDGPPVTRIRWTPASADSQVVLKLLDAAPDGTLTLLSRGVQGVRGASAGEQRTVRVAGDSFSSLIRRGHRAVAWVSAGDASFYKQYPGSAGGTLQAGNSSTLTLPLQGEQASQPGARRRRAKPTEGAARSDRGGAASAPRARTATAAEAGGLAFTGLPLLAVMAAGLGLASGGFALRRLVRSSQ